VKLAPLVRLQLMPLWQSPALVLSVPQRRGHEQQGHWK
jgi:hypothetical protein